MNRSKINVFKLGAMLALALVVLVFGGQAFGEDDDEDGGTIIFVKPVKAVVFEHKNHIDQGLECDSCHDDLFEMETGAAEASGDFTMKALDDGKYCAIRALVGPLGRNHFSWLHWRIHHPAWATLH